VENLEVVANGNRAKRESSNGCPDLADVASPGHPDGGTTLNDIPEAWAGGAHFGAAGVIVRDVGHIQPEN